MSLNPLRNSYYFNPYQNQINFLEQLVAQSNKKLSTGKQINSAADAPSMVLQIGRLESQMRGSQIAQNNIQDGMAFLDVKDAGLGYVQEIGKNLRDLAVRYQNNTLTNDERQEIFLLIP